MMLFKPFHLLIVAIWAGGLVPGYLGARPVPKSSSISSHRNATSSHRPTMKGPILTSSSTSSEGTIPSILATSDYISVDTSSKPRAHTSRLPKPSSHANGQASAFVTKPRSTSLQPPSNAGAATGPPHTGATDHSSSTTTSQTSNGPNGAGGVHPKGQATTTAHSNQAASADAPKPATSFPTSVRAWSSLVAQATSALQSFNNVPDDNTQGKKDSANAAMLAIGAAMHKKPDGPGSSKFTDIGKALDNAHSTLSDVASKGTPNVIKSAGKSIGGAVKSISKGLGNIFKGGGGGGGGGSGGSGGSGGGDGGGGGGGEGGDGGGGGNGGNGGNGDGENCKRDGGCGQDDNDDNKTATESAETATETATDTTSTSQTTTSQTTETSTGSSTTTRASSTETSSTSPSTRSPTSSSTSSSISSSTSSFTRSSTSSSTRSSTSRRSSSAKVCRRRSHHATLATPASLGPNAASELGPDPTPGSDSGLNYIPGGGRKTTATPKPASGTKSLSPDTLKPHTSNGSNYIIPGGGKSQTTSSTASTPTVTSSDYPTDGSIYTPGVGWRPKSGLNNGSTTRVGSSSPRMASSPQATTKTKGAVQAKPTSTTAAPKTTTEQSTSTTEAPEPWTETDSGMIKVWADRTTGYHRPPIAGASVYTYTEGVGTASTVGPALPTISDWDNNGSGMCHAIDNECDLAWQKFRDMGKKQIKSGSKKVMTFFNNAGRSGEGGAVNFFGAAMGSCIAVFDCDKGKSAVLEGEQAYKLWTNGTQHSKDHGNDKATIKKCGHVYLDGGSIPGGKGSCWVKSDYCAGCKKNHVKYA